MAAASGLPDRPGWYQDPYSQDSARWFDGTMWTTHAVPSAQHDRDRIVRQHADGRSAEEMRTDEWKSQFPWWDTAVARGDEPPFAGRGGARGFEVNQATRLDTRLGNRMKGYPIRAAGWLLLLALALFAMAWVDDRHRTVLIVLAALTFAASLGCRIRAIRSRERWRRVGQEDETASPSRPTGTRRGGRVRPHSFD